MSHMRPHLAVSILVYLRGERKGQEGRREERGDRREKQARKNRGRSEEGQMRVDTMGGLVLRKLSISLNTEHFEYVPAPSVPRRT